MGEEKMVKTTLTKEMIEAGAALVRVLDKTIIRPDAAFWLFYPDDEKWKLVLSEVALPVEGSKRIYQKIQEVLSSHQEELQELSLDDITLAQPKSSIVASLRHASRIWPGSGGVRFTKGVIDGSFIDDAYIYRVQ